MCSEFHSELDNIASELTAALRSGDADAFTDIYDHLITMTSIEKVSTIREYYFV